MIEDMILNYRYFLNDKWRKWILRFMGTNYRKCVKDIQNWVDERKNT